MLERFFKAMATSILLTPFMEFDSDQEGLRTMLPFFPLQEETADGIYRFHGFYPMFFRYEKGFGILADTRSQLLPTYSRSEMRTR